MVGGEHELQMVWGFLLLFIFGFWKSVCPQNAVEDKRKNYIGAEVGEEEEEEERICCFAAVSSAVFHIPKALPGIPLSEDQHLTSEWFPNLVPEGSGPLAGEVSWGWRASCCPVPQISSAVKLMLLFSHSGPCIKSSAIPGLCLGIRVEVSHSTKLTAVQGTWLEMCVRLTLEVILQQLSQLSLLAPGDVASITQLLIVWLFQVLLWLLFFNIKGKTCSSYISICFL